MSKPRLAACLPALTLALALALSGCAGHVLPAIHSDAERLRIARELHDRGHYGEAIELLKAYTTSASGTAQVDEAIYLLADSYLRQKEWASAQSEFERLLRDYPESDSAATASFRLGEALYGQSRGPDFDQEYTLKALQQWQSYLRDNPGHWLNGEAQSRITQSRTRLAEKLLHNGNLYLKLRLFRPARVYFRKVIDDYPETAAAAQALLGLALCDAREGRRAEAIEQLRQVEARYAGQEIATRAARERKRLERG